MSIIKFSENESAYYGVKVGRTDRLQSVDLDNLETQINAEQYDIVKVKLDLKEKDLFEKLNRLPYFIENYSIITLQKRVLSANEELIVNDILEFELYDGTQTEELRNILEQILLNDNIFYNTLLLDSVKPNSNHSVVDLLDYYLLINNSINSNDYMFIAKIEEKAIGLCSFRKTKNNEAEGILYGIIPEFRNKRLAEALLNFSLHTLANAGVETFNTEVLFQNKKSLYPHIKSGFKPAGLYLNAILYPMTRKSNLVFQTNMRELWININRYLISNFQLELSILEKSKVEIKGPFHLASDSTITNIHLLGHNNNHFFFKALNGNKTFYLQVII